jgi:hypothetical protein
VVTVVVLCPLQICVISNGHLPISFLGLFVTLDGNGRIALREKLPLVTGVDRLW